MARVDSYEAYSRNWDSWEAKGYPMSPKLSKDDFSQAWNALHDKGMPNIAREMAKADREMTIHEARLEVKEYNEITGKNLKAKDYLKEVRFGNNEKVHYTVKGNDGKLKEKTRVRGEREARYLWYKEHGKNQEVYGY